MRKKWTRGIAVLTAASLWMMTTGTCIYAEEASAPATVEAPADNGQKTEPAAPAGEKTENAVEVPKAETPVQPQKTEETKPAETKTEEPSGSGSTDNGKSEGTAVSAPAETAPVQNTESRTSETTEISGTSGSQSTPVEQSPAMPADQSEAAGTSVPAESSENKETAETSTTPSEGADTAASVDTGNTGSSENTGNISTEETGNNESTVQTGESDHEGSAGAAESTENAEISDNTEGTDNKDTAETAEDAENTVDAENTETPEIAENGAAAAETADPAVQPQEPSTEKNETSAETAEQQTEAKAEETEAAKKAAEDKTKSSELEKLPVLAADGTGAAGQSVKMEAPEDIRGKENTTSTTVTIDWDDDNNRDDVRPGGVFADLVRKDASGNVEKIGTLSLTEEGYELTVNGNTYTGTRDEADAAWSFTITDLQAEGDFTYEWQQEDLDRNVVGYAESVIQTETVKEGTTTVIMYKHVPAKAQQSVRVVWDDSDNVNGDRPSSINVRLSNGDVLTLTAADGWQGAIKDLPMYTDGKRIEYIWTDEGVTGYYLATEEISGNETVLTYKWVPTIVETKTETSVEVITTTEIIGEPKYTLTVRYWDGTKKAFTDYTAYLDKGDSYKVVSPGLKGYSIDKNVVSGTIRTNTVVNVYYTAREYQVTVLYRYMDGRTAAPAYRANIATGKSYSITSPDIAGYTVNLKKVTGTVSGQNMTYVVYYDVPRPAPVYVTTDGTTTGGQTIDIREYETPLGVGTVAINAGDCYE